MKAIDVALRIYRRPSLVHYERRKPLPEDVLSLILIAGGENVGPEFLSADRARSAEEAREASVFFLQQVLLSPKSSEFRQLGLPENATPTQIREHRRHMLKWLHPDRNPNKWESALFQRVAKAADELVKNGTVTRVENPGLVSFIVGTERKRKRSLYKIPKSARSAIILHRGGMLAVMGLALAIIFLLAWRFYAGKWSEWYEVQGVAHGRSTHPNSIPKPIKV